MSGDYTQTLTDHDVLASVGSTGDAYRVWRTRSQRHTRSGSNPY
jgi:hypothetical protein